MFAVVPFFALYTFVKWMASGFKFDSKSKVGRFFELAFAGIYLAPVLLALAALPLVVLYLAYLFVAAIQEPSMWSDVRTLVLYLLILAATPVGWVLIFGSLGSTRLGKVVTRWFESHPRIGWSLAAVYLVGVIWYLGWSN